MKYAFKTKPHPPFDHQIKAIKRAWRDGHHAFLWEPGTGKTRAVIDWACALFQAKKLRRMFIVCPLSVTGVWEEEFETYATSPYNLFFMDKTWYRRLPPDVVRSLKSKSVLTVVVANYDIFWRRKDVVKAYAPTMVIADESHRCKKPSARRSRFLRQLNHVNYRGIMSGTPTPKGLMDIYAQWVFLNYVRFGTDSEGFKDHFAVTGGFMGFEIKGYRNVKELKRKIRQDASIVLKDKALDLPPRTYARIPIRLEDDAQARYDQMAWEMYLDLENGEISDAKNAAVRLLRLQQIVGGWINSDEGNPHQVSEAKIKMAKDKLEDLFYDGQRVVAFARFIPEVGALAELGADFGVRTYVLRGGVPPRERDHIRREFQAKKGPSLFVAQIQTGGLGITLHSSHEVLFYSVTYALDDYIQACDRVHRQGQKFKVTYRHLIAKDTVEEDIYAALRRKKKVLNMIMSDPSILKRRLRARRG